MRHRTFWISIVLSLTACDTAKERPDARVVEEPPGSESPAQPAPDTKSCDRTITGSGLGELRIGLSVDSARRRCTVVRDTTDLGAEGMPARVISVRFGNDTTEAEVVGGKVWRIEVNQRGFQTRDSLHVGTPLSRLLEFPGVHTATGEGAVYLLSPEHCGLSFRLSGPGLRPLPPDMDKAKLERLPPNVVVSRILIVGCQRST